LYKFLIFLQTLTTFSQKKWIDFPLTLPVCARWLAGHCRGRCAFVHDDNAMAVFLRSPGLWTKTCSPRNSQLCRKWEKWRGNVHRQCQPGDPCRRFLAHHWMQLIPVKRDEYQRDNPHLNAYCCCDAIVCQCYNRNRACIVVGNLPMWHHQKLNSVSRGLVYRGAH